MREGVEPPLLLFSSHLRVQLDKVELVFYFGCAVLDNRTRPDCLIGYCIIYMYIYNVITFYCTPHIHFISIINSLQFSSSKSEESAFLNCINLLRPQQLIRI